MLRPKKFLWLFQRIISMVGIPSDCDRIKKLDRQTDTHTTHTHTYIHTSRKREKGRKGKGNVGVQPLLVKKHWIP